MRKNERNAGRKTKFKKGIATFILADKLPKPVEKEIRKFVEEVSKPFLNDEQIKSKRNEIQRGAKV